MTASKKKIKELKKELDSLTIKTLRMKIRTQKFLVKALEEAINELDTQYCFANSEDGVTERARIRIVKKGRKALEKFKKETDANAHRL